MKTDNFNIDDITWNDLNMDAVFNKINTAKSSVGEEFLKNALKYSCFSEDTLLLRNNESNYLDSFPDKKKNLSKVYSALGKIKKTSFLDYIFKLNELPAQNSVIHYILAFFLLASIASVFFIPIVGIVSIVVFFIVNISTYFSAKNRIEGYFQCVKYLVSMVIAGKKIMKLDFKDSPFSSGVTDLKRNVKIFSSVQRGSWLITNSVSGSLVDVIMDYVRMLFHVDIIKFNSMLKTITDNPEAVMELYTILGEMELAICINDIRENLPFYTVPVFNEKLAFNNLCHPLVKKPVGNELEIKKSILLTGSNASGKSTFLKSIAINQIMAQSLYTCYAQQYKTGFYKVMSSMALNDNILNNESYFVVEVKSLKRIIDANGDIPVLCFIDEVLRGTNTKERIAASTSVLKYLSKNNFLCLAATHDIELTELLANDMDNYHFSEYIIGNEVTFDYLLKQGPSTSHNAIKLIESYGFPIDVIKEANLLI